MLAAAVLLAAAPSVHADAELTVSPLIIDVDAKAGDVITETISATASGSDPIAIELVHADFGFGEDYAPVLIRDDAPETTAFSTRGWFSLPRDRYRIAAGATVDLPLRIEVPQNTPGGTYLGAALLRVVPSEAAGAGSQVQAVAETGPLLFIAVEGGDPPEAAMKAFDVPGIVARGPLRPKLTIENLGDEHFTFEGTITMSGPGADDTAEIRRQYVVPGEPRSLRTSADDPTAPSLGTKRLAMGRYTLTSRLRIEPVGTTLVATRTVWVIPIWARFAGVALVLVFLASVWTLARWLSHRRTLARYVREELAAQDADPDAASWDEDFDEFSDDELSDDELR